jgi:hypothetical protein
MRILRIERFGFRRLYQAAEDQMKNQQYILSQTLAEIIDHVASSIMDPMLDSDIMDLGSSTSLSSDTESSGTNLCGSSLEIDLMISRSTGEIKITAVLEERAAMCIYYYNIFSVFS